MLYFGPVIPDGEIMDYRRVLLVPFHPTSLMLVGVFAVVMTFFDSGGIWGIVGQLFLQIWIIKYCYVLLEHIADGAPEPPVMDVEMLSPVEIRPWVQLGVAVSMFLVCRAVGGSAGSILALVFLLVLPATVGVLGTGEPFYQAINPVMLWRLIHGLGLLYLAILAALPVYGLLCWVLLRLGAWSLVQHAVFLLCQLSFFSLVGGAVWLRRRQLGFEPSRSPERTAAREEGERVKLRARMIDDVFQQVRVGKHVEATRPLAKWLSGLDGETAALDASHVATQAVGWESPAGLNTLASTLIRHLLRAGRPDTALLIFERLRQRVSSLTLDSADDLRALADYAEAAGRRELAVSMRLETPVIPAAGMTIVSKDS